MTNLNQIIINDGNGELLILKDQIGKRCYVTETEVKDYTLAEVIEEAGQDGIVAVYRFDTETMTGFDLVNDLSEAYFAANPIELHSGEPDTASIPEYFQNTTAFDDACETAFENAVIGSDRDQHSTYQPTQGHAS